MEIKEELLFNKNKINDSVEEMTPVTPISKQDSPFSEDVLFNRGAGEEIPFIEPAKCDKTKSFDVLFKGNGNVSEESLNPFITPATVDANNSVSTEVLYKFGIEDIAVEDDVTISEESIKFAEPIKPDYVSEEVLFSEQKEIATTVDMDLFSEPLISSDEASQLSFNDLAKKTVIVREPKKPFAEKMLLSESHILEKYQELKNILLSFKKVKSRLSNTCDTFNLGRTKLAKLSVSGKSLKLYVNLNLDEVEPKLRCKDASSKKAYEEVPVFLRVRSDRSMKYAKMILSQLASEHQLVENPKAESVDAIALLKDKLENK